MLLHGFADTWRTWDLVLAPLERRHEVLAPTLAGHAGGPPLTGGSAHDRVVDAVEGAMDAAGWETAHVAGNSLGGHVALRLAARGRARTVVALAPAGGWEEDDASREETFARQGALLDGAPALAPYADVMLADREARRRATRLLATNFEHIPPDLLAHQLRAMTGCDPAMLDAARREPWALDPERIACPVRMVWGTEDRLLPWPSAAARYRAWLPNADWVVLDGVGHCPQLDVPLEAAELILGFTDR